MKSIAFCLIFAVLIDSAVAAPHWPKMQEFDAEFPVQTNANEIAFVKTSYDLKGIARYTFVCRGGSTEYLDKLGEEDGNSYVAVLACVLNEGKDGKSEGSLLAEDDSATWYTRGQYFTFDEVIGDCGNYPEYGRLRHFRLRGFELTLSAENPIFDKQQHLQSFTLKVSLRRDGKINSRYTEQPGYLTPYKEGRSCKEILKGNEQRMCRDWTRGGSWGPCKD